MNYRSFIESVYQANFNEKTTHIESIVLQVAAYIDGDNSDEELEYSIGENPSEYIVLTGDVRTLE
mgnify:FL=1